MIGEIDREIGRERDLETERDKETERERQRMREREREKEKGLRTAGGVLNKIYGLGWKL